MSEWLEDNCEGLVDLTDHETKIKSIVSKKRKLGTTDSSKATEVSGTTPRRVEPKILLRKGKRSNIHVFRGLPLEKFPEELRERNEKNSKLPEPEMEPKQCH